MSTTTERTTPAPWTWRFSGTAGRWMLVSAETLESVQIGGPPNQPITPDMQLSAAAPELAEALRGLLEAIRNNMCSDPNCTMAVCLRGKSNQEDAEKAAEEALHKAGL